MAYEFLEQADIDALIDAATFTVITEDNIVNAETLEQTAIEELYAYLDVRYDAEQVFLETGTDRNASVVTHCVDVLLYHLHSKVMPDNIPELRKTRYDDAIDWLKGVAGGFISPRLPIEPDAPSNQLRSGSSTEKRENYF